MLLCRHKAVLSGGHDIWLPCSLLDTLRELDREQLMHHRISATKNCLQFRYNCMDGKLFADTFDVHLCSAKLHLTSILSWSKGSLETVSLKGK